mgnify:CR=1 FL=1
MNTIIVTENQRSKAYPALFGSTIFRGQPLFSYAEDLFYSGLSQMVVEYNGGFFDFLKLTNNEEIKIEVDGFIPLLSSDELVSFTSPFGNTQKLTLKGACLVTWLFVLEQISNNNSIVRDKLYRVIQDIKYAYYDLIDEKGDKIFSEDDCTAIYKLLD